jgi:hypothetical protein
MLTTINVKVKKTPISERYCKVGDEAILDKSTNMIRCSGAWFRFNERWKIEENNNNEK